MIQQDGGISPDDVKQTAQGNANDGKDNQDPNGQNGGGNADITKRLDDMQALIESLKKESSGKDN